MSVDRAGPGKKTACLTGRLKILDAKHIRKTYETARAYKEHIRNKTKYVVSFRSMKEPSFIRQQMSTIVWPEHVCRASWYTAKLRKILRGLDTISLVLHAFLNFHPCYQTHTPPR